MKSANKYLALLIVLFVIFSVERADATSDYFHKGDVLGVSKTGTFVYKSTEDYGCETSLLIVDREGTVRGGFTSEVCEPKDSSSWEFYGNPKGVEDLHKGVLEGKQYTERRIAKQLHKALNLKPLRRAKIKLVLGKPFVKEDGCGSLYAVAPKQRLFVFNLRDLTGSESDDPATCGVESARLLMSPYSPLFFLTYKRDAHNSANGFIDDDVTWFPKNRLGAMRKFNQGRRFYKRKKYGKAIEVLRTGLRLDPNVDNTRVLLARALQEAGPWNEETKRILSEARSCNRRFDIHIWGSPTRLLVNSSEEFDKWNGSDKAYSTWASEFQERTKEACRVPDSVPRLLR